MNADRVGVANRQARVEQHGPATGLMNWLSVRYAAHVAGGMPLPPLFISERTVDSHVRILNKLGASSRAQIAAWMTSPDR